MSSGFSVTRCRRIYTRGPPKVIWHSRTTIVVPFHTVALFFEPTSSSKRRRNQKPSLMSRYRSFGTKRARSTKTGRINMQKQSRKVLPTILRRAWCPAVLAWLLLRDVDTTGKLGSPGPFRVPLSGWWEGKAVGNFNQGRQSRKSLDCITIRRRVTCYFPPSSSAPGEARSGSTTPQLRPSIDTKVPSSVLATFSSATTDSAFIGP